MKKAAKVWLIIAVVFVVLGLAIFIAAMAINGWDFGKMGKSDFETNTYEVGEKFEKISIDLTTDDISFRISDDKSCKVVCREQEKTKHTVEVKDKTLEIKTTDNREWFEHISLFGFESPQTTVYLPEKDYDALVIRTDTGKVELPGDFTFASIDITGETGDVTCSASSKGATKIDLSTGSIEMKNALTGALSLSVSTGHISMDAIKAEGEIKTTSSTGKTKLKNVTCDQLSSGGSTGDMVMSHVLVKKLLSVERSTGDIVLDGCDAGEIYIKTSTGDVTGILQSEKVFITETDTGDINVPKTSTGGKCEIETNTGDIRIDIQQKNQE